MSQINTALPQIGLFILEGLGMIVLTVIFQDFMTDQVAKFLPGTFLIGKARMVRGKWKLSYTKGSSVINVNIMLRQIGGRVWGKSEREPTLGVTYYLMGSLKGDKLSGIWTDTNPISKYHGVYLVDINTDGDKANGSVLSEDPGKNVTQYGFAWERY